MGESASCSSCGMTIESGPYCEHCSGKSGELIPFDECFERMIQWTRRENPSQDRSEAEQATLQYMKRMPAWREHPRVIAG